MGVCNCSMYCCTLLYVHSSIAIILMGKRGLIALLNSSSWCLVMVERLFLGVPWGCLQFVIVVFPDHTHLLFFKRITNASTWCQIFCPQTHPDLRIGSVGQNSTFSEHGHVAYLIKENHECSNMLEIIFPRYPLHPRPWVWGQ